MKTMDDNFDGRISYNELKQHFTKLGFSPEELDGEQQSQSKGKKR